MIVCYVSTNTKKSSRWRNTFLFCCWPQYLQRGQQLLKNICSCLADVSVKLGATFHSSNRGEAWCNITDGESFISRYYIFARVALPILNQYTSILLQLRSNSTTSFHWLASYNISVDIADLFIITWIWSNILMLLQLVVPNTDEGTNVSLHFLIKVLLCVI